MFQSGERGRLFGQTCLGGGIWICHLGIHSKLEHTKDSEKICSLETYLAGFRKWFPKLLGQGTPSTPRTCAFGILGIPCFGGF